MTELQKYLQLIHAKPLFTRILQGAVLSFILVLIFLLILIGPDPEIFIPASTAIMGGAFAGAFYYLTDEFRAQGDYKKILANIACLLVFFAGSWVTMVFGLAITGHWN